MRYTKKQKRKAGAAVRKSRTLVILGGTLAVIIAVFFVIKGLTGAGTQPDINAAAQQGGDVKITKSEITEKATFIPYDADGTYMGIVAVKAPDGTVRTAFNTCQVCFDSGRGYYIQEGGELVCQNCGNRFKISQIEKEKNGCNPIPILEADKNDDGTTMTITESVIKQNADYFSSWNKA